MDASHSRTYRISINRIPLIEKPDKDFPWNHYMTRFEAHDITPGEFVMKIGKGFGFAPVFGNNGYPNLQNFAETQFIAIDMDTEDDQSSLKTLSEHPLVAHHGAIIYPTHSHTDAAPRHRVVFLLDQPIRNAVAAKNAIDAITALFGGADNAGNANKTWQANGKIDFHDLWDKVWYPQRFHFPPEQVVNYMSQWQARQRRLGELRTRQVQRTVHEYHDRSLMTLKELADRLKKVNPYAMDYTTWVRFCAAIAHCYGDTAFWLVKDWSDIPGKTPLTMAVYKSMMRDNPQQAGYGTIIHILKEHNA